MQKVRYERADEFIEVTQKLWDSWEDDSFLYNKESGQFFDAPSNMNRYIQANISMYKVH